MSIPMVEVFLPPKKSKQWEAVAEPINSTNKLEWFEDLKDWKIISAPVVINGKTKNCQIYLSSAERGWIQWDKFSSEG
jgi:hypothetical protein